MTYHTKRAKMYAEYLHKDQKYGGYPYTYHLQMVVDQVCRQYPESPKLDILIQVAWLHDAIEDTEATAQYLIEEGFSQEVVEAVLCLTKYSGTETIDQYYNRVASNKIAFKVKVCDTLANLQQSCKESQTKRINKYTKQVQELYLRKK